MNDSIPIGSRLKREIPLGTAGLVLVSAGLLQFAKLWASDVGDAFWVASLFGILAAVAGVLICFVAMAKGSGRTAGVVGVLAFCVLAGLHVTLLNGPIREEKAAPEVVGWYTTDTIRTTGAPMFINSAGKNKGMVMLVVEARFPNSVVWKKSDADDRTKALFELHPHDFRMIMSDGKEITGDVSADQKSENPQFSGSVFKIMDADLLSKNDTIFVAFVVPERSVAKGNMTFRYGDQPPMSILSELRRQPPISTRRP
jgi:hypothetical protein